MNTTLVTINRGTTINSVTYQYMRATGETISMRVHGQRGAFPPDFAGYVLVDSLDDNSSSGPQTVTRSLSYAMASDHAYWSEIRSSGPSSTLAAIPTASIT